MSRETKELLLGTAAIVLFAGARSLAVFLVLHLHTCDDGLAAGEGVLLLKRTPCAPDGAARSGEENAVGETGWRTSPIRWRGISKDQLYIHKNAPLAPQVERPA
jgi:hypothetical protein